MRASALGTWGVSLLLLGACASQPPPPPPPPPEEPIREELVRRLPEAEPEWAIRGTREEDEDFLYFVGYSSKQAEERNAVDEARRDAGNRFVEYCGIEARVFSQFLSVTYGLSSEVQDATQSGVSGSKQQSEAYFSRLKLVERSLEVYREVQGDRELKRFWRVKALVRVPRGEYDAVQSWKAQREQNAEAVLAKMRDSALNSAKQGNLLAALQQLEQLRQEAPNQQTSKRAAYVSESKALESQWLGAISLKVLSGDGQVLEPGDAPVPLRVQVQGSVQGQPTPLKNFPVTFLSGSSSVPQTTNAEGIAEQQLPEARGEGSLVISVAPDPDRLQGKVPEAELLSLVGRQVAFRIKVEVPFLKRMGAPDFPLSLRASETRLQVGQEFQAFGSCGQRCHLRLYVWDGAQGVLLINTSRRLLRDRERALPSLTPDAPGRYTLIALASTESFPDAVQEGTAYDSTEFAVVLKNFRNMTRPKAEAQVDVVVE